MSLLPVVSAANVSAANVSAPNVSAAKSMSVVSLFATSAAIVTSRFTRLALLLTVGLASPGFALAQSDDSSAAEQQVDGAAVEATVEAPVEASVEAQVRAKLGGAAVGLPVKSVEKSEIAGLYRVQLKQGPAVYTTANADFFILGDLFSVGVDGFVNLAEQRRSADRKLALAEVPMDNKIVFAAEGDARAYITVFTDVSCFYCQKLHKEVPELNRRGVEVRYLAYPRQGIGSPGFRQLASAWCADDRQTTLTRLKNQEPLKENVCPGNPVAQQFALGQQLGVQGTPAIVTANGELLPGYRSADDLISALGLN